MRRWIHPLVVALLCLTLFVDTAKACWFLRHHRRAPACRPVPCRPVCQTPCCPPCAPVDVACGNVVEEHLATAATAEEVVEFTVDETVAPMPAADAAVTHKPDVPAAAVESVVQHGPTLVVGPNPSATAPVTPPEAIATAPAAEQPAPIAAPRPLEQAAPAVPEADGLAAREPLPNLKPAQPADPVMVAPASNDEPVNEPAAATDSQAKTAAARGDVADGGEDTDTEPPVVDETMPAEPTPVADLAGGPAARAPQEPNLFDLYDDEASDDDAPAGERAADSEETEETEMTEEEVTGEDAKADDADAVEEAEEMAEEEGAEDATDEEADANPAEDDAEPEDEPAATENDPFAAVTVPDEPMRRWTDDTGTRHAQGWLVELHADRVRILKTNGRHTTVTLESLSAADRDYVTAVGARMAAERTGKKAAATATAGL